MASGGDGDASRNLVVDEAAFEEQFLRCHICQDRFDQDEKTPKSLPCNHTFCLPCLKQVFDHNQQNTRRGFTWADETYEGVLKCPTCRVEIFLSRAEITALPNDHRVIQMMDFLSQVVVKSKNVCSKHERQPLNFFCKTCMGPVCRDCTVLDHKEPDHVIVDVSQALQDNSEEFDTIENRSKTLLGNMKSRSDSLANASKQLDLLERQLRGKIKDTFIEYRLMLEKRQEGQIAILHDMIKSQKALINARFVDVCTQGSKLQKLHDSFTKARPANDITQLFTVHNEMKEHDEDFAKQAEANDDDMFISFDFEVTNDPLFLSEMSCLGDLTQKPDMDLKKPVPAHQLVVLDMEERRHQEAQGPDMGDYEHDCDDLIVTGIEPSTGRVPSYRSRADRMSDRSLERLADRASARTERLTGSRSDTRLSERAPQSERAVDRIARLRAREIIARERDHDRDVDEAEEMDHETAADEPGMITSSYLLRIASRLNATNANLSEAILDLSTDRGTDSSDDTPTSTTATGSSSSRSSRRPTSASGPSPPRTSRSSQNVRVVRHPQVRATPDRSDRYISTRYDRSDRPGHEHGSDRDQQ